MEESFPPPPPDEAFVRYPRFLDSNVRLQFRGGNPFQFFEISTPKIIPVSGAETLLFDITIEEKGARRKLLTGPHRTERTVQTRGVMHVVHPWYNPGLSQDMTARNADTNASVGMYSAARRGMAAFFPLRRA